MVHTFYLKKKKILVYSMILIYWYNLGLIISSVCRCSSWLIIDFIIIVFLIGSLRYPFILTSFISIQTWIFSFIQWKIHFIYIYIYPISILCISSVWSEHQEYIKTSINKQEKIYRDVDYIFGLGEETVVVSRESNQ